MAKQLPAEPTGVSRVSCASFSTYGSVVKTEAEGSRSGFGQFDGPACSGRAAGYAVMVNESLRPGRRAQPRGSAVSTRRAQ